MLQITEQLLIACVTLVFCSGRRSLHQYDDPEEEVKSLIYKYAPVYAAKFTGYEQIYFFWASWRSLLFEEKDFNHLCADWEMIFHQPEERFLHHFILLILFSTVVDINVPIGINKELFLNILELSTFVEEHLLSGAVVMDL